MSVVETAFIRMFFRKPVEEDIAVRWARRLARLIGHKAADLRPETTLAELLSWAEATGVDTLDFACIFEPELRREFARFLDEADHSTFREMVESTATWYGVDRVP